jgi:hypothetical protein
MYFPDNFAGVTAVSERVHRLVVRWWRTASGDSSAARRNTR